MSAIARAAGLRRSPVMHNRSNSGRSRPTVAIVSLIAGIGRSSRRPAQLAQAARTSGSTCWSSASSTAYWCTQSSRNSRAAAGLQRSGSPLRRRPKLTIKPRQYSIESRWASALPARPASCASGEARKSAGSTPTSGTGSVPDGWSAGKWASRASTSARLAGRDSSSGRSAAVSVARRYPVAAARIAPGSISPNQVIPSGSVSTLLRIWSSTTRPGDTTSRSLATPRLWSASTAMTCSGPPGTGCSYS